MPNYRIKAFLVILSAYQCLRPVVNAGITCSDFVKDNLRTCYLWTEMTFFQHREIRSITSNNILRLMPYELNFCGRCIAGKTGLRVGLRCGDNISQGRGFSISIFIMLSCRNDNFGFQCSQRTLFGSFLRWGQLFTAGF